MKAMSPQERDKYLLKCIEDSINQWEKDNNTMLVESHKKIYLDYGPTKVCRRDGFATDFFFRDGALTHLS
jgi:hypothetical protein